MIGRSAWIIAAGWALSGFAIAEPPAPARGDGPEVAARDVSAMRRDEMLALSKTFEGRGEPGRAQDLKRRWLEDQRLNRLSDSDAEGRLLLALEYVDLIDDKESARLLLVEALKIDPNYRKAEEALKRIGFRKVDGNWVEADRRPESDTGQGSLLNPGGGLFQGLTEQQVKAKLGKPDQIIRSASQGQVVEQWVYRGPRTTQYINLIRRPNLTRATVEAYYSIP